jgi:hypothetical protein
MKKTIVLLLTALIFLGGCTFTKFIGTDLSPNEGESEFLINAGATILPGNYHIFIDGESRDTIKNKGGSAKYIVKDGQHVVSVEWHGAPGTQTERAAIQVTGNSNRMVFHVIKPSNTDKIEIKLEGVSSFTPVTPP